jgi:hypothetical protein
MCEKCVELDAKIERCQRLLALVTDKPAVDGMEALLKSYLALKLSLHPRADR